jgi:hypothetical protein
MFVVICYNRHRNCCKRREELGLGNTPRIIPEFILHGSVIEDHCPHCGLCGLVTPRSGYSTEKALEAGWKLLPWWAVPASKRKPGVANLIVKMRPHDFILAAREAGNQLL